MSIRSSVPSGKGSPSVAKSPTAQPATQGSQQGNHQPGQVPHEKIAMRAYDKWCQRGCPPGTNEQDWLEAENELKTEMAKTGKQGR